MNMMKTEKVRDAQQTSSMCTVSLVIVEVVSYISKRSRPLGASIREHKYNLTQALLGKSKLFQHAYEESHKICWKEAKIEPNTT
jgi:hypothetical protein